jgi:hypothetical protein
MSTPGKLIHIVLVLTLALTVATPLACGAEGIMSASSPVPAKYGSQGTKSLRVLWTISSYHLLRTATMGESEAQAMLFKPLDIGATTITFAGESCGDVLFRVEEVETEQYFKERFRIAPLALGVDQETVEVVRTNCRIPGFDEYARLRDRTLLVPMRGVVFVFTPRVNK